MHTYVIDVVVLAYITASKYNNKKSEAFSLKVSEKKGCWLLDGGGEALGEIKSTQDDVSCCIYHHNNITVKIM